MNEVIPRGYISIRDALNRVGRELFPLGLDRRRTRGGEWLKIKDVPPGAW
jgi:hypothetical protein